jgi:hypothetical protein
MNEPIEQPRPQLVKEEPIIVKEKAPLIVSENKAEAKKEIIEVIDGVQNLTRTTLPVDQIIISDSDRWAAIGPFVEDENHTRYAIVFMDHQSVEGDRFIYRKPSDLELQILWHEFTHIITEDASTYVNNPLIRAILSEGVSIAAEFALDRIKSNKISVNSVIQHCQEIVTANKELLETDSKEINSDKLQASLYCEYDGFLFERDLVHIAGLSFVQQVLGDEIWKWRALFSYPPSVAEVIEPQKYKERMKEILKNYQVSEIKPIHPELI